MRRKQKSRLSRETEYFAALWIIKCKLLKDNSFYHLLTYILKSNIIRLLIWSWNEWYCMAKQARSQLSLATRCFITSQENFFFHKLQIKKPSIYLSLYQDVSPFHSQVKSANGILSGGYPRLCELTYISYKFIPLFKKSYSRDLKES